MEGVVFKSVTLERILCKDNFYKALCRVESKKYPTGLDGIKSQVLRQYLKDHPKQLRKSILDGTYRARPIVRKRFIKDNEAKLPWGIPSVLDRLVQQAIVQVLSEEYEGIFCDLSYGYRPHRSEHMAVVKIQEYVNNGAEWIVDLKLAEFFETVNHNRLIQLLSDRIKDGRVISLIHKILRAPISEKGTVGAPTTQGVLQDTSLSPLLANILLHELDVKITERGLKAVRYLDDCVALRGSKKAAERALAWISKFVEKKLFLKVDLENTKIFKAGDSEFVFRSLVPSFKLNRDTKGKFPEIK